MVALLLLILGAALALAGVAVVYWPAALIVAGVALCAAALVIDFDTFGRGRQ